MVSVCLDFELWPRNGAPVINYAIKGQIMCLGEDPLLCFGSQFVNCRVRKMSLNEVEFYEGNAIFAFTV